MNCSWSFVMQGWIVSHVIILILNHNYKNASTTIIFCINWHLQLSIIVLEPDALFPCYQCNFICKQQNLYLHAGIYISCNTLLHITCHKLYSLVIVLGVKRCCSLYFLYTLCFTMYIKSIFTTYFYSNSPVLKDTVLN